MKEEEKILQKFLTIFFNRRLCVAEKLKIIKYSEERSIHAASNYNGVSRPTTRYWIKEKEELM